MSGYAYIGRESCGCVTCVTLDDPAHKRDVAKDIAQWVRWGMTVERVTVEAARSAFTSCPHKARASALAAGSGPPSAVGDRPVASGGAQGLSFGEVANGTGAFDSRGGR